jgi:hypothetical protein
MEEWTEAKKGSKREEANHGRYEHGAGFEGADEGEAQGFALKKVAAVADHKGMKVNDWRRGNFMSMSGKMAVQHVVA